MCVADGCPNITNQKGQLCTTHGGKRCSVGGCSTRVSSRVKARGLCGKHGDEEKKREKKKKLCLVGGCSSQVSRRGLCDQHCRKPCSVDGCSTKAKGRGLCIKHGAYGYCTTDACIITAATKRGACQKHDSKTVACSVEGCSTNAVA